MSFLRRIFGGGGQPVGGSSKGLIGRLSGDNDGLYIFVKPHECQEIIRVRIHRMNDLSGIEDGSGFMVRKVARGQQCRKSVEITVYFNGNRGYAHHEADGGELVTQAEYDAWVVSQESD